jgi:CheY-like chemotaxis protein
VSEQQDKEKLRARIRELESLCTDVLVAGVDLGLPQHLLNQLWAAVGNGELPHAYDVDLPQAPPRPAEAAKEVATVAVKPAAVEPPAAPVRASLDTNAAREADFASWGGIPDIPLTNSPTAADDTRPKPPQAELKPFAVKKTVAVVDDDPMMLDVLARILQRENFELLMAGGGPEIMERLSTYQGQVDLLVTDYAMPGMQGRELADRLRERFPALKVLYQTGFSDMLFENRVELEDGAAFLEKPFTARGMREAARLVLFGSINP